MKRDISITLFALLSMFAIYTGIKQSHIRANTISDVQYSLMSEPKLSHEDDWVKEIYSEPQKYYNIELSADLQQFIMDNCRDADPRLIIAIAYTESGFNPSAISDDGLDYGIMGIRKKFATERMERLNAHDLLNPHDNILVAVDILSEYIKKYGVEKAVIAYKCGENSDSMRYRSIKESRKVFEYMEGLK